MWKDLTKEKPTEYGKYEVYRKGCKKQHYETWNNTGWAYNNNDITHWRLIVSPLDQEPCYNINDLVNERMYGMAVAADFMAKYRDEAKFKEKGSWQQIICNEKSEASRYIMNAISGRTGLNADEPLKDVIIRSFKS